MTKMTDMTSMNDSILPCLMHSMITKSILAMERMAEHGPAGPIA